MLIIRLGELSRNTLRIPIGVGQTFKSGMDMTYWYDLSIRNWYFISIVELFIFEIENFNVECNFLKPFDINFDEE